MCVRLTRDADSGVLNAELDLFRMIQESHVDRASQRVLFRILVSATVETDAML